MMKMSKSLVVASVLAAGSLSSGAAMAEVTANIGATSNYMWRGITQTADGAAVSGGMDYAHESGAYVGTWGSNTAFGSPELDLYLGYAGEMSGIGYDVGYISYMYPNTSAADFSEVYVGASYEMFSAKLSHDSDNKNTYIEAAVDFDLGNDFGMGVHFGSNNSDGGTDFTDYSVSVSKGDFSLALSDNSENVALGQSDNYRVAVSWGQSF